MRGGGLCCFGCWGGQGGGGCGGRDCRCSEQLGGSASGVGQPAALLGDWRQARSCHPRLLRALASPCMLASVGARSWGGKASVKPMVSVLVFLDASLLILHVFGKSMPCRGRFVSECARLPNVRGPGDLESRNNVLLVVVPFCACARVVARWFARLCLGVVHG